LFTPTTTQGGAAAAAGAVVKQKSAGVPASHGGAASTNKKKFADVYKIGKEVSDDDDDDDHETSHNFSTSSRFVRYRRDRFLSTHVSSPGGICIYCTTLLAWIRRFLGSQGGIE
jgi:hypothetical protein